MIIYLQVFFSIIIKLYIISFHFITTYVYINLLMVIFIFVNM